MKDGDLVAWAGAVATAGLGFIMLREDYYGPASLVTAFALAGLYVAAAWRAAVMEGLAVLAGLFAVALVAAWHLSAIGDRSEEQTSELQSLMRSSSAVFCLQKNN